MLASDKFGDVLTAATQRPAGVCVRGCGGLKAAQRSACCCCCWHCWGAAQSLGGRCRCQPLRAAIGRLPRLPLVVCTSHGVLTLQ